MSARRGQVWLVDFDPVEGHEQAGRRPALIRSVDPFNESRAGS
jgi:mRNA interferase MazF